MTFDDFLSYFLPAGRAVFGLIAFLRLKRPERTSRYRRELWAWSIALPLLGITGLRGWLLDPTIHHAAPFLSLFQCAFNIGIALVSVLRFRLQAPASTT